MKKNILSLVLLSTLTSTVAPQEGICSSSASQPLVQTCSLTNNKGGQLCKDYAVSAASNQASTLVVTITNISKAATHTMSAKVSIMGVNNPSKSFTLQLAPGEHYTVTFGDLAIGTYTATTEISDVCTYVCSGIKVK